MSRWECCFINRGDAVPPCKNSRWKELGKGNVDNIDKGLVHMSMVPPNYYYPCKYVMSRSFEHRGQEHRYYEHVADQYHPFYCRQLPACMPLNIEVNLNGRDLTVKLFKAITGDCLLVLHLTKNSRWSVLTMEREAKRQLAAADRYTPLVPMKFMHHGDVNVIPKQTVIWNPKWKNPKVTRRIVIKTTTDQLKLTHYWSRATLAPVAED